MPETDTLLQRIEGYEKHDMQVLAPAGLHARNATLFSKEAEKFPGELYVVCDGMIADGKNIMDLLVLGLMPGTMISLHYQPGYNAYKNNTKLQEIIEMDL